MKKLLWALTGLLLVGLALAAALGEGAAAASGGEGARLIDLTGLVSAAIAMLLGIVTKKLLPWIEANTSAKQQALLRAATDTAVYAAQQLYRTREITDRLEYASRWLRVRGYRADRAEIEAAVRRMDATRLEISAHEVIEGETVIEAEDAEEEAEDEREH